MILPQSSILMLFSPSAEIHTDSEAYLSDAHGRSVTPMIVPLSERDPSDVQKGPQAKKFFSGPSTKPTEAANKELNKLRDQKIAEGPTMGREGSRLANEKRRRGFLDDEDFEDVIVDSD